MCMYTLGEKRFFNLFSAHWTSEIFNPFYNSHCYFAKPL